MRSSFLIFTLIACFLSLATPIATLPIDRQKQGDSSIRTHHVLDLDGQTAELSNTTVQELELLGRNPDYDDRSNYFDMDPPTAASNSDLQMEDNASEEQDTTDHLSPDPDVLGPHGLFRHPTASEDDFPHPPQAPPNIWEGDPDWNEFLATAESARSLADHVADLQAEVDRAIQPDSPDSSNNDALDLIRGVAQTRINASLGGVLDILRDLEYELSNAGPRGRLGLASSHESLALGPGAPIDCNSDEQQRILFSPVDAPRSASPSYGARESSLCSNESEQYGLNHSRSSNLDPTHPAGEESPHWGRKRPRLEVEDEDVSGDNDTQKSEPGHSLLSAATAVRNRDGDGRKAKKQRQNEKPVVCPGCPRSFKTEKGLSDHLKADDCWKYICGHNGCPYTSPDSRTVERHWNTTHSGAKKYHCKPCNADFARKDHYDRHMRCDRHAEVVAKLASQLNLVHSQDSLHTVGDVMSDGLGAAAGDCGPAVASMSVQDQIAIQKAYHLNEKDSRARDKRPNRQPELEDATPRDEVPPVARRTRPGIPPIGDYALPEIQDDDYGHATHGRASGQSFGRDHGGPTVRLGSSDSSWQDPWEGSSRDAPRGPPDDSSQGPSSGSSQNSSHGSQYASAVDPDMEDWSNIDPELRPVLCGHTRASHEVVEEDEEMADVAKNEDEEFATDEDILEEAEPP